MIPEEIILNAAENINTNLAKLTDLEKKLIKYAEFGQNIESDSPTGWFSSYKEAFDAVLELFYQSDVMPKMASCRCNHGSTSNTLIFFSRECNTTTFAMYDTTRHQFYNVTKNSDGTYTEEPIYVTQNEIQDTYLKPLKENITTEYTSLIDTVTTALDLAWEKRAKDEHSNMMNTLTAVDTELRTLINNILDGADADLDQFKEVSEKIKAMLEADQSILDLLHNVETTCVVNGNQTNTYTLIDNQSINFNNHIKVLNITIPSMWHGFKSYISFEASEDTLVSLLNNSGRETIWLKNSVPIELADFKIIPAKYNILFECNGTNVYIRIEEIEL